MAAIMVLKQLFHKHVEKYYNFMFEGKVGARLSRVQSNPLSNDFLLKFVSLGL